MDHVLTLIAGADAGPLDAAAAAAVRAALDRLGADTTAARWLSPGRACDLDFAMLAPEQAEAAARSVLGGAAVDVVAQPAGGRRKRLLVADMDSTMIRGESIDELAAAAGRRDAVAPLTAQAMRGEVEFAASLRERVALLAGLDAGWLERIAAAIEPMPGAVRLVATMAAHGARTVLVSGGFLTITGSAAALLGFHAHRGNTPGIAKGRLDGRLAEPVLDAAGKLAVLTAEAAEHKIPLHMAMAVGDGANDIQMLGAAGMGVAFHAKPAVAARARARIDHADLTALLYLQGYSDDEMA